MAPLPRLPSTSNLTFLSSLLLLCLLQFVGRPAFALPFNVSFDYRSLIINGTHRILNSGSIHYPRSTPEMWPDLIDKARLGGLDVVESYVFWDQHEPAKGHYDFEGRLDLVRFIKVVQRAGLFVNLRIGPYISAEWNFGGLPVWLHLEPRVVFRTDNVPFKAAMLRFVTKIVDMMKEERLFAWQGGPIILTQIENEFGTYPAGTPEHAYAMWSANALLSLNTGVPSTMCLQYDAPYPVINTFNSYYADDFYPNGDNVPKMWTEDWTGWFQSYGQPTPYRPVEDLAYAVSRFFQKNGSFQNYYMYHGGTNFGRTAGGPFITTSYDYDAPLDEYGLVRQPKWGHLRDLHHALKLSEPAMRNGDASSYISLGANQEVYIFSNESENCAAFISNSNLSDATVQFNGRSYQLPAWSVSILPDCENVAFNSAQVTAQTSLMAMRRVENMGEMSKFTWGSYAEKVGVWGDNAFEDTRCHEQIRTCRDTTDYLWYITSLQISESEPFLQNGSYPVLMIDSMRDAVHVFINGKLTVSAQGKWGAPYVEAIQPVNLHAGTNQIAILSMTVGLQSGAAGYDLTGTGIQGSVYLEGLQNGTIDLSTHTWIHQVGVKGEHLGIYSESGVTNVHWSLSGSIPRNQSLIWYKTYFDAPTGDDPVALDLSGMGKGQAWVNGQSIGRFWPSYTVPTNSCSSGCDYRGVFNQTKCVFNCGQPSQKWYHVPRSWLMPQNNLLILFEEIGGDPTSISLVIRVVDKICGYVSENYPPPVRKWPFASANTTFPQVRLECGNGQAISSVSFASFGTPMGLCGNFQRGLCHASRSLNTVKQRCLGRNKCIVEASARMFGEDPCVQQEKKLAVEAQCS